MILTVKVRVTLLALGYALGRVGALELAVETRVYGTVVLVTLVTALFHTVADLSWRDAVERISAVQAL